MSTAVVSPAMNMSDAIDQSFAAAVPVDSAVVVATPTETAPVETNVPTDTGIIPSQQLSDPAAPTELDFSTDTEPDSIDQTGRRHFYTVAKSQRLQAAAKFVQAIQDYFPNATPEDIKLAVEKANAADALMLKYHQGPSNIASTDEVLDAFIQNENPQAFGVMAVRMVSKLAQIEPEALQFLDRHFNAKLIEDLKSRARATVDPKERTQAVALVQRLQMALSGGNFEKDDVILSGANADPSEMRLRQINDRERSIQEREAQHRRSIDEQWETTITNQENAARNSEIEGLIAKIAPRFEKTGHLPSIRAELYQSVADAELSHREWHVKWQNLRSEANMTRTPASIEALANYRRSIAKLALQANAKSILDRWGGVAIQSTQAATDRAGTAAPNELSPNGVAPSAANGIDINKALQSKNFDQAFKSVGW